MKKIILFARDPGGANVIIPLVKPVQERYHTEVYGKDAALLKFRAAGVKAVDIMEEIGDSTEEEIERFLQNRKPDLVITGTSADDRTEKLLWSVGEKLAIPSFAILDQWVNYGIRFSRYGVNEISEYEKNPVHEYLPAKILVMDDYARGQMEKEGIDREKIAVTGQPYLEWYQEEVDRVTEREVLSFRHKFGGEKERLIVFASEPICKTYGVDRNFWGYTERSIFEQFQTVLESKAEKWNAHVNVVIRPHPKEDIEGWTAIVKNTDYVKYFLDKQSDAKTVIKGADLIVGMTSMFLLESVLCGRPVLSLQMGLCRENGFILEKQGILKSVLTKDDLENAIQQFFRNQFPITKWNVSENAVENVIKLVEKYIG